MSYDTFAKLPNWLLRRRDVSATAKLLYARLLQYQGDNETAWPAVGTLAAEIGVHRSRVIVHTQNLEKQGLLKVERRVGYRATNRYRLLIPTGSGNATSCETRLVVKCDLTGSGNATPLVAETLPKENKKRFKEVDQSPVEIPPSLNVPNFLKAWKEFEQHRRELRKKLTPLAARKQLASLAAIGPDRAVIAINHSIKSSWLSIHEPQGGNHDNTNRSGRITGTPGRYANTGTSIG